MSTSLQTNSSISAKYEHSSPFPRAQMWQWSYNPRPISNTASSSSFDDVVPRGGGGSNQASLGGAATVDFNDYSGIESAVLFGGVANSLTKHKGSVCHSNSPPTHHRIATSGGNIIPRPPACPSTFRRQDHQNTKNFSNEYLQFLRYQMNERQNKRQVVIFSKGEVGSNVKGRRSIRVGGKGLKNEAQKARERRQTLQRRKSLLLPNLLETEDSSTVSFASRLGLSDPIKEDAGGGKSLLLYLLHVHAPSLPSRDHPITDNKIYFHFPPDNRPRRWKSRVKSSESKRDHSIFSPRKNSGWHHTFVHHVQEKIGPLMHDFGF
jgi:hypothetical protein